jgi:hypothetical protein
MSYRVCLLFAGPLSCRGRAAGRPQKESQAMETCIASKTCVAPLPRLLHLLQNFGEGVHLCVSTQVPQDEARANRRRSCLRAEDMLGESTSSATTPFPNLTPVGALCCVSLCLILLFREKVGHDAFSQAWDSVESSRHGSRCDLLPPFAREAEPGGWLRCVVMSNKSHHQPLPVGLNKATSAGRHAAGIAGGQGLPIASIYGRHTWSPSPSVGAGTTVSPAFTKMCSARK